MALVERHAPGTFSWVELITSDQNAAKSFYGSLFGWQPEDHPMGPGFYTMFRLQGRAVAGCYSIPPGETIPPAWVLYVATDDAAASAARAVKLGGSIIEDAFDVSALGRMAVLRDPTGAVFSLWQSDTHIGTGIAGVHGTLCWADLNTPNRPAAAEFYRGMFGWTFDPGQDQPPGSYLHIHSGGRRIGGIPPDSDFDPSLPAHWLVYFQVSSLDASTAAAAGLGARVLTRPAVLADPQGAAFALFEPH